MEEKSKKQKVWDNVKIPTDYRTSKNDKWSHYSLGSEAGEYAGWTLVHPAGLVKEETVIDEVGFKNSVDTLIFRADNHTFSLRNGSVRRKMAVNEFKERFDGLLDKYLENQNNKIFNEATANDIKALEEDERFELLDENLISVADNFNIKTEWDGSLDNHCDYITLTKQNNKFAVQFLNSNSVSTYELKSAEVDEIDTVLNKIIQEERSKLPIIEKNKVKEYVIVPQAVFAELKERQSDIRSLIGSFEEDILSSEKCQIIRSDITNKYLIAAFDDIEITDDGELKITKSFCENCIADIQKGKETFYNDLFEATVALCGGVSKTFDTLSDDDKKAVESQFTALYEDCNGDYNSLPTKEEYVKRFLIEKGWAKWKNYKNDKAYENTMPYVLRNNKNFVNWKLEFYDINEQPRIKPAKVPVNPKTGGYAMPNNYTTWGTFEEACAGVSKWDANGIGIVFNNRGLVGIDLDGCIDKNGNVSEFAMEIVKKVNSYTEISPSGTGLHIFAFAKIPENINNQSAGIEMYCKEHYVIFTGNRLPGTPPAIAKTIDAQPAITEIYEKYKPQLQLGMYKVTSAIGAPEKQTATSQEIIERMKRCKNFDKYLRCAQGKAPYVWDTKTGKFTEEIDRYFVKANGEPDISSLDLAFCKGLAFFRATPEQIDEIYRAQSLSNKIDGITLDDACLARAKWDRPISSGGITYGQYVINGAYAGTSRTWGENSKFAKINAAKAAKVANKTNFNDGGE